MRRPAPNLFLRNLFDHLTQDTDSINSDSPREFNVLDHIYPPLAQLDLRDKGLRTLESFGDVLLSQACGFPGFDQSRAKGVVGR
jgi:hypothetical protein